MNSKLLKAALEKIQSVPVLINMVSKRERELINGAKPLVNPDTLLTDEARAKHYTALDVDKSDVALAEIAQGKLSVKDMHSGEQQLLDTQAAAALIRERLAQGGGLRCVGWGRVCRVHGCCLSPESGTFGRTNSCA